LILGLFFTGIHSVVQVIFISMSIALGIVLLGVLIGFLIGYKKRRDSNRKAGYPVDRAMGGGVGLEEEDESEGDGVVVGGGVVRRSAVAGGPDTRSRSSSGSVIENRRARRPTSLLATIDAATAAMTERMQMRKKDDEERKDHGDGSSDDDHDRELHQSSPHLDPNHEKLEPTLYRHSSNSTDLHHQQQEQLDSPIDQLDDNLGLLAESDVRRARWSFDPQLVQSFSLLLLLHFLCLFNRLRLTMFSVI
jgi:hypothetical protein